MQHHHLVREYVSVLTTGSAMQSVPASPAEGAGTGLLTCGCFEHISLLPLSLTSSGVAEIQKAALPPPPSHLKWCIVVHQGEGNRSFWKEAWAWTRRPGFQAQLRLPFLGFSFHVCAMGHTHGLGESRAPSG